MPEQLNETIEDIQFRALQRIRVFDPSTSKTCTESKNWVAASSRYGICVLVVPGNKLYACSTADVHRLGAQTTADSDVTDFRFRTLEYHNPRAKIKSIAVNSDGSVISFAINTPNGPFVEIFDVISFAPIAAQQQKLFPVASIRLSSQTCSSIVDVQWNPVEMELFAALTSDNVLSTFKYSLEMGSSFSLLGVLSVRATCLCWSPKGKQLAIGDADGKVHQLKPDLSPVRVVSPPAQIPIFGSSSNFSCVGLCWLSTTEWLVSHKPCNSTNLSPNLALLVVKKQQPPKWVHFGDVFLSSREPLTFYPMLDWQMVFTISADSPSVAVFGLRGDNWVKFEFDMYDMEMPLTADSKDTFPLGITLDFSSTSPISIGEGSDRKILSPPPFVHFINSSGLLLPYAIVSLASERPSLTKTPEKFEVKNAKFGQPPVGNDDSTVTPPTPDQQPFDEQTANNSNEQQKNDAKQKSLIAVGGGASEEGKRGEVEERERMEMLLKGESANVEALERALEKGITEYTAQRNRQMVRIEQLGQLRREVEKSASAVDTGFLVDLHSIKKDLLQSFKQSLCLLDKLCMDLHSKIEFLNGTKLSFLELKGGTVPELKKPSFDMEKRLQLIAKNYENIVDKLRSVRRLVDRFDGLQKFQILRQDGTIDPIEQRKVIQINENIAKMSAKLGSQLQQIRRSIGQKITSSTTNDKRSAQLSVPLADFCALELDQLKVPSADSDRRRLISEGGGTDVRQFQNNLRHYLMGRSQEVETKRIIPLKRPESKTVQKLSTQPNADYQLVLKIANAVSSPPRPKLVSIGVQSPDFVAKSHEKTPKKVPSKKMSTPLTARTPLNGKHSIRATEPAPSFADASISLSASKPLPSISSLIPSAEAAEKSLPETPVVGKTAEKVTVSTVTSSTVTALSSSPTFETTSQIYAKDSKKSEEIELVSRDDEAGQTKKDIGSMENTAIKTSAPSITAARGTEEQNVTTLTTAEEGMEDEVTDTTGEAVTFDFMKSGLGSCTPIDASRNPFGSMVSTQNGSGSTLFGTAPSSFGTPAGSFGTPSTKPAFGSLGASPTIGASLFGASPFSSPGKSSFGGGVGGVVSGPSAFGGGVGGAVSGPSAFGGGAFFGSVSPFASAKASTVGFVSSPFGGGPIPSGKSMFGGGIDTSGNATSLGSGFSAFANKSAGFGQLATQQQQQSPPSLFGGGTQAANSSFNQPKTSAFTTFRK